jgi:uncharacterized Zn-finger protein
MESFICPEETCGLKFTRKANLNRHYQNLHYEKCSLCEQVLKSFEELQNHYKQLHPTSEGPALKEKTKINMESFICPEKTCGLKFTRKPNLNRHYQNLHYEKCSLCEQVFKNFEELQNHYKHLHPSEEEPALKEKTKKNFPNRYKCELCQKEFKIKVYYERHLKNYHEDKTKRYTY